MARTVALTLRPFGHGFSIKAESPRIQEPSAGGLEQRKIHLAGSRKMRNGMAPYEPSNWCFFFLLFAGMCPLLVFFFRGSPKPVHSQRPEPREPRAEASYGAFAAIGADGSAVTWGDTRFGGDSSQVQDQRLGERRLAQDDGG